MIWWCKMWCESESVASEALVDDVRCVILMAVDDVCCAMWWYVMWWYVMWWCDSLRCLNIKNGDRPTFYIVPKCQTYAGALRKVDSRRRRNVLLQRRRSFGPVGTTFFPLRVRIWISLSIFYFRFIFVFGFPYPYFISASYSYLNFRIRIFKIVPKRSLFFSLNNGLLPT